MAQAETAGAWEHIRKSADQARAAHDFEQAIAGYTDALACDSIPYTDRCAMLAARADCYWQLGTFQASTEDLQALEQLAGRQGDIPRQVDTLSRLAFGFRTLGNIAGGQRAAEKALLLAEAARRSTDETLRRQAGPLQAKGLVASILIHLEQGKYVEAEEMIIRANTIAARVGDLSLEGQCLWLKGFLRSRQGKLSEGVQEVQRSVECFRQVGDREWEAMALNMLANSTRDHAWQRSLYEQALLALESIGNRGRLPLILSNLGFLYFNLGLYRRAREYTVRAIEQWRASQGRSGLMVALGNLGLIEAELGRPAEGLPSLEEALKITRETGSRYFEATISMDACLVELYTGQTDSAINVLKQSVDMLEGLELPDQALALARLGGAYLLAGNVGAARQATQDAVDLLDANGISSDSPRHEIWWWHYRALAAGDGQQSAAAWQALKRALAMMLEPASELSDAALRRSYLHRVKVNRLIAQEWLRGAKERGLPLNPLTAQTQPTVGSGDRFERLQAAQARISAHGQGEDRVSLVLMEVSELLGAERLALVRRGPSGERLTEAAILPIPPFPVLSGTGETAPDQDAFIDSIAPVLDQVEQTGEVLLAYLPDDAQGIDQVSVICVPIREAGRVTGLLYADLSGVFGRFDAVDRELLCALAQGGRK